MKKQFYMLAIIAFALSFSTVSCEGATVPAPTTGIEKAMPHFAPVAESNGAINNLTPLVNYEAGTHVECLKLSKIHWVTDETFYATGYKALLNKKVKEIIAPPRS